MTISWQLDDVNLGQILKLGGEIQCKQCAEEEEVGVQTRVPSGWHRFHMPQIYLMPSVFSIHPKKLNDYGEQYVKVEKRGCG